MERRLPVNLSLIAALGIAVLASFPLLAQFGTATITGRVTDPSGAVVPGVSVEVVHLETNFRYTAQTNAEGIYRVASLNPGRYRISFEAEGFKRFVRDNVDLRQGDVLAIDVTLEIGAVAESIEVSGRPQLLETETSATGTTVQGEVIYDLPIYQRWLPSVLQLVPGMQQSGYAWGGSLGAYHIAGQRSSAIAFYEDGVNAQDQGAGTQNINPIMNAVAEVKVLTTTLPAEYGHSAGGVISVVKKSGTNQFHGLASIFGRSRSMQHRRFFDKCRTSQNDPVQGCTEQMVFFLQPDFNLSGPVWLPKLYDGRNKTFWLVAYQKLIEKKTNQFIGTTPTAAMKNGDFTFNGLGRPLYDPWSTRQLPNGTWTRDPIPGNIIPKSRFDPVARKIIEIDPWVPENQPGQFDSRGPVDNLIYDEHARVFFEDWSGRIDHQFNPYVKVYGSYTYNYRSGKGRPSNIRIRDFDGEQGNETPERMWNGSVGNTWVISPTVVNDIRLGYFRRLRRKMVPSYGKNWPQQLGIPNVAPDLMPAFGSGSAFSPESIYGLTVSGPNTRAGDTWSFREDFSFVRGRHAFKTGYELLRFRMNFSQINRPSGDFRFDNMTAGLQPNGQPVPNTGNTFAGFLLGAVRQATFDSYLAAWLPRSAIHSVYFQDDWKATPNLTFNIGIRYSNETPFTTKWRQLTNFDPNAIDDVTGRKGGFVHPRKPLFKRDNNNFQPRFGMAWRFHPRWVLRGGFAVNTVDIKYPSEWSHIEEYYTLVNFQQPPGDPRPVFRLSDGPPRFQLKLRPDGTAPYYGTNYSARTAEFMDGHLRNPYVLNWNTSIQLQLSANYLLELSYQGSAGVRLVERWEYNTFPIDFGANDPALREAAFARPQDFRPFPHFGSILYRSNMGHSTYHGGTIKLEKRYSAGLTFITFYTFSKSIDSQDSDNSGSGVAPIQNRGLEKARAGWDRNHRFSFTATYELPFGQGRRWLNRGGIVDWIFGGWEIAGIQTMESGTPLNFTFANSPYNYFPTWVGARRPNVVGKPRIRKNWRDFGGDRFNSNNINPVIDINYFAYPPAFTPGNAGRNIVTGLPLIWTTVSAQKNFRIKERLRAQLRWDMNNPFKTFNFDPPTTTVDFKNPKSFGKVTSDPRTASWGGQPLMNLTLALLW